MERMGVKLYPRVKPGKEVTARAAVPPCQTLWFRRIDSRVLS